MLELMPYRRRAFTTALSPEEVAAHVKALVAEGSWYGWIERDRFGLSRRIGYMHAPAMPVLTARIMPSGSGSEILLTVRLTIGVYVFGALWMTFAISVSLVSLVAAVRDESARPLIAWVFPIVGAAILTVPFKDEAGKLERVVAQRLVTASPSEQGAVV